MTPTKKRYTFWIEQEQVDKLKKVRARDGILPSEQLRRALDDWFQRKGVKKTDRKRGLTRKRS